MREFLSSHHVSLACSILNAGFAGVMLVNGSWIIGGVCILASGYCYGNYLKGKNE
jgi:hypothetical protein